MRAYGACYTYEPYTFGLGFFEKDLLTISLLRGEKSNNVVGTERARTQNKTTNEDRIWKAQSTIDSPMQLIASSTDFIIIAVTISKKNNNKIFTPE